MELKKAVKPIKDKKLLIKKLPIKKLLIANRGEIACRIIKTCKKMGIKTVAVYSQADTNSLHVQQADEAIHIGDSAANMSYLNANKIVDAVKMSGADAVHPGYGFLSENAQFAKLLQKYYINFVGPSVEAIQQMGDKIQAKKLAKQAGVNVVPGYMGAIDSADEAVKIAEEIGYPIMLKAAAGGGGKGIRVVRSSDEMLQAFQSTQNEARNSFADPRTFIEKFIENPRHIEIQLMGDKHGNYVCLGERECSIQRHHQKVIEEAPSIFIDEETRQEMYRQAVLLSEQVGYFSAGTVEYIVDTEKNFYFLEMNTRLQVEHPVTELITGYDIVELMIKIARGERLPLQQSDVKLKGWAFESRIYAEDPTCGFIPSTGRVYTYKQPEKSENIRVDTGIYEGGEVSMYYDPMIAKLCSYAETRDQAIDFMNKALDRFIISGISHNISFLQAILTNDKFRSGDISTNFIEQEYADGFTGSEINDEGTAVLLASAVFIHLTDTERALAIDGQLRRSRARVIGTRWVVKLDDRYYPIVVRQLEGGYKITFEKRRLYIKSKWVLGSSIFQSTINDKGYNVQIVYKNSGFKLSYLGQSVNATVLTPRAAELSKFMKSSQDNEQQSDLIANISGLVVDIKVKKGDPISKGQPLMTVEAMKMENIFSSAVDGIVSAINHEPGDTVNAGDTLIEIEATTVSP